MSLARKTEKSGCIRLSLALAAAIALTLAIPAASSQHYRTLEAQPDTKKARVLRSLVNSAGYQCDNVTTILFKGADRDKAGYWAVACADGGNWMVQVANDSGGSSNVTPCSVLKRVGVECWEKF